MKASLKVNGVVYEGWTRVRVTRGIDQLCGTFELEVTDSWHDENWEWKLRQGDECEVRLNDKTVLKGFIEKRAVEFSASGHRVGVAGRDRTGQLIECSAGGAAPLFDNPHAAAVFPPLGPWEFKQASLVRFVEQLVEPFGIPVVASPGLADLKAPQKVSIDPGDTIFSCITTACQKAGVLAFSDEQGRIHLAVPGLLRAHTNLVEGENILAASASFDSTDRFHRYVVLGQSLYNKGSDQASIVSSVAEARDEGVSRRTRLRVIHAHGDTTIAQASQLAQWAAAVHAARSVSVSVTVQGWTQGNGELWPVNALVKLRSPVLDLEDEEMLISQVVFSLDESSGTTTELTLTRPDAFVPEPVIEEAAEPESVLPWDEIKLGV